MEFELAFLKHFLMEFNGLLSITSLANANLLIRIHEFQFYKLNELAKRFFQGWPSHCKVFTQVLVGLFAASLANTQTFDVSQL